MKKLISSVVCIMLIFNAFCFSSASATSNDEFEYYRNYPCRKTYDIFRFLDSGYNAKLSDSPASFEIGEDYSLKVKLDKTDSFCRLFFDVNGENHNRLSKWLEDSQKYHAKPKYKLKILGDYSYSGCPYEIKIGFTNNTLSGWSYTWYNDDYSDDKIHGESTSVMGEFGWLTTEITKYFVVEISLSEDYYKTLPIPEYFYFTTINVDYYLDCCDYEYDIINLTHTGCPANSVIERKRCKVCGYNEDKIPAAVYYKVVDKAVKPTCLKDGLTEGSHCNFCNEILVPQKVVKATGHNQVLIGKKSPTYFKAGYTGDVKCKLCGETLSSGEKIAIKKLKKPTISKITKGKSTFTVKFKKVTGAQGYEISVYKNGKWTKFTTKKLKYTVKKLTKGKTYKVKIRAFVKQGKQTKYSKYSATKKVKL